MKVHVAGLMVIWGVLSASISLAQTGTQPVPTTAAQRQAVRLNLKDAVDLALGSEGNPRVRISAESLRQARARSAQSRAALLPNVETSVSEQSRTTNLAALGIQFQIPIPGFVFPKLVGPFTVFDARATASQTVFDLSSIRRYQASRAGVDLASAEDESTQDQVRSQVATTYLAALRADAALETAHADLELAQQLLDLASSRKGAGTATGIEVTRARVQLANEKQRLLVAENERTRAYLQLLRAIGMDLNERIELTEKMTFVPVAVTTLDEAMKLAFASRYDWKAQLKREEGARLNASAVKWERLPSVAAFGDYGTIGPAINDAIPTRTYGFAVRIPVFDGGRRDARRSETGSQLVQERLRSQDLRDQIELEVRVALDNLGSAAEQVRTAEEGVALAENEQAQAQRRYEAGVGSSIEVTDAQTRLQRARDNRIIALFNYNLARIDLGAATGTIRQMIQ